MPSTLGKAFTLGVGARTAEAEAPAHATKATYLETGEHQDVGYGGQVGRKAGHKMDSFMSSKE